MKSTHPPQVPALGARSGIRFKVLLGLTVFNIAATLIFSVNHYLILKSSIMDRIHDQLSDFARTLPELLPEGYLDRAVNPQAVAPEEYRRIVDRLTRFCNEVGLRYLYSYAQRDQGFYCTSSNGTAKEMAENTYAKYWELYKDAPREIAEAWTSGEVRYYLAPSTDQYGECYALFVRKQTAAGTRYIAGADLPVDFVNSLLERSLVQSALLGAAVFACFFLISFFVASRFSSRIVQLAAYTRELAGSNFRPDAASPLRRQVVAIPERTKDEVGQLAGSFLVMEQQLDSYLQELKETTAAKERFQNELKIAGDIQAAMLPHEYPSSDRLDLHAAMKPAKEAGGDLYDCFFLDPDHLCFVIGDVSDKGMPAALFMAVTLTIVRAKATAALAEAPEEILRQTNELLVTQNQMYQFVTMFLGVLDVRTGQVVYADGGHNRPYHRSATAVQMLPRGGGVALGVMSGAAYQRHTLQLQPGETLFLYTDGVTEAIAADESFYGEARLEQMLSSVAFAAPASVWVESVMKNVFEFSHGHAQADDITVLAVRFRG
jgi:sigma-B regulation protein RsbU (phosphoserine phosphatase)